MSELGRPCLSGTADITGLSSHIPHNNHNPQSWHKDQILLFTETSRVSTQEHLVGIAVGAVASLQRQCGIERHLWINKGIKLRKIWSR